MITINAHNKLHTHLNAPHFRASIRIRTREWVSTHFDQLDRFFLMKSTFRAHPSFFRGGTAQWTADIECIHFLAPYMYWYRNVQGQINLYPYQPLNCQWGSLCPLPKVHSRRSWTCLTLKFIMKTGPTQVTIWLKIGSVHACFRSARGRSGLRCSWSTVNSEIQCS